MPGVAGQSADYGDLDPQSYLKGAAGVNALVQNFATRQAGQSLANGDTAGAVQTLDRAGDLAGANTVQNNTNTQTTFANTQTDRTTAAAQAATEHDGMFMLDVANTLESVRQSKGDAAVLPAFDQLVPVFQARGGKPEEIAMIRQQLAQDPENFIAAAAAHGSKILEPFNLSEGQVRYDPNGKIVAAAPSYHELNPDQKLVRTDPGIGGTSAGFATGVEPGGAGVPPGQPAAPAPAPVTQPAATGTGGDAGYLQTVDLHEGRGQNPRSSASGFGQFLGHVDANGKGHGTWFDVMRGDPQFAQLIAGKSDAEILQMRQNPQIAQAATISLARTNGQYLQSHGLPATPANVGLAHGFGGAGAADLIKADMKDPNMPASIVLGPLVIKENPQLANLTVGQIIQSVEKRFGGHGVPAPAPAQEVPDASGATTIAVGEPAPAADTKGAFNLSPGQTHFDASGKPVASLAPKDGPGSGKLPPQDAARMKAIDTMADQANTVAGMASDFMGRAKGVQTGWQYNAVGAHNAAGVGVTGGLRPGQIFNAIMDTDTLGKIQELDALTNRAAPMLRPNGSGRILGPEYGNFLRAFPSTKNDPTANVAIAGTLTGEAQSAEKFRQAAHAWANAHGNLDGFDADFHKPSAPAASGSRVRHWVPGKGLVD